MSDSEPSGHELELWAGAECTVNRVGEIYFDQLRRTGSHDRLDDLERLAALGARAVRFPVLWERVQPSPDAAPDFSWSDQRLERLRELGLRPIVGLLHHGSGPQHTHLCDPKLPEHLARYAELVARRYPWVEDYTPVNEPLTTARFSALYGHWYPHRRDTPSFLFALVNQVRAVAAAMRAIRRVNPHARLVQTEDAGRTFATPELADQAAYEDARRWLSLDLLFGRVDAGHPMRRELEAHGIAPGVLDELVAEPCPPEVIGLNYYLTSDRYLDQRLERYPEQTWGGNGRVRYADVEAVRVARGARDHAAVLREAWKRYGVPLAITEVHLGCSREQQLRWLEQAWNDARRVRAEGADVRAVTLWSVFGSVDWTSLVTRDLGEYEPGAFDVRGPSVRPTALAEVARMLATGQTPDHPALAGPGWWQSNRRVLYPHDERLPEPSLPERQTKTVLIVGQGTFARRVAEICDRRGLHHRRYGEGERAEAAASGAWAVVLAHRPKSIEAALALLDGLKPLLQALPVLAFSSDLVFDGRAQRPYVEPDARCPTPEGSLWCQWEAALSAVAPSALVLRSGPLLDPASERDPLAEALLQIARGGRVRLPDEERIAPTYVPHLLDAALDLLIDRASGLWHVASRSHCSPLDLARAAALRAELPAERLERGGAGQSGLSRGRHSRRALSSVRGWPMPDLERALTEYVIEFKTRRAAAA